MDAITAGLRSGRYEVIDADLSGYFDTIPHAPLLRLVARRVSDGAILKLINGWLRAPVVEPNRRIGSQGGDGENRRGTPQGDVISPLLANAYLNRLDWNVNERCELKSRTTARRLAWAWAGQCAGLLPGPVTMDVDLGVTLGVKQSRRQAVST